MEMTVVEKLKEANLTFQISTGYLRQLQNKEKLSMGKAKKRKL